MVSAIFHSPLGPAGSGTASSPATSSTSKSVAAHADSTRAGAQKVVKEMEKGTPTPYDWRGVWLAVLPPVLGLLLLIGLWALVSISTASSIPSPLETFKQAVLIFSDPF
ncbi:MAG: nitrate ABC transporter permease, partial [Rhodoferax sp.]